MGEARSAGTGSARRTRVRIEGAVQGVGFRPFVHRLVRDLGLSGWARNDGQGVLVEVEGTPRAVERFLARLGSEAPPLADVVRVAASDIAPAGDAGFRIVASEPSTTPTTLVPPDTAPCDACLAELFDPGDRRHRYPFVNCTACGPRFTIVRQLPYDRPRTTMAGFPMCGRCRAEYEDPGDRRFHAEPNACPACGPRLRVVERDDLERAGEDALRAVVEALDCGRIVAIKGVGGFHLACRADDERAVCALPGASAGRANRSR
jgi:hydrogenase maturation protein HypF